MQSAQNVMQSNYNTKYFQLQSETAAHIIRINLKYSRTKEKRKLIADAVLYKAYSSTQLSY